LHILGEMNKVIGRARDTVSDNAPAMVTMKVESDKIRDVIGKGGATIRGITEETGASIDIEDDGTITIFGEGIEWRDAAVNAIEAIVADAEVGRIYVGKVVKIADFGAFVNILPGKDGLVHISQIANKRVEKVTDYLSEGQEVKVIVLDTERGRIKLSIKEVPADEAENAQSETVEVEAAETAAEPIAELVAEEGSTDTAETETETETETEKETETKPAG
nr:S1 RNA-binding domain-containing protein [Gammaproteobacteria bacterium]